MWCKSGHVTPGDTGRDPMAELCARDSEVREVEQRKRGSSLWTERAEHQMGFQTGFVQQFRGGLVFKAHGLLYHSTLGLRVTKKKKGGARPDCRVVREGE